MELKITQSEDGAVKRFEMTADGKKVADLTTDAATGAGVEDTARWVEDRGGTRPLPTGPPSWRPDSSGTDSTP